MSVLNEMCSKRHWHPPKFELMEDIGPAHHKTFRFKVYFTLMLPNLPAGKLPLEIGQ